VLSTTNNDDPPLVAFIIKKASNTHDVSGFDDDFFAIVDGGRLYFRTSDATRPDYEDRGMQAFAPTPKQVLKNYFEVPVDVLEDDSLLCDWARKAVQAQRDSRKER